MRKKIVHIGKYYAPEAGGIENVTCSVARGSADAGFQVSVVCFTKSTQQEDEVLDGVKVIRAAVGRLIASQPLSFKYILLSIREARQADIIHVHLPNMLGALCCLFVGKRPRLLLHWHSDVVNKGVLELLLRPLEKAILKRADCVVATSEAYAQASPLLQNYKEKVTVVPIGVPDVKGRIARVVKGLHLTSPLEQQLTGKKLILAVGRLVEYKGFNVLIEAAKHLHADAKVVIVGDGPLRQSLQDAIATNEVEDRVHLAGRIDDDTLNALFSRAAIYCLPSINRAEAFGVVQLEAMAHGVPVVATDIVGSGVPWVNKHGVSGLNVAVGDPLALAQACNQILIDERIRAKFAEGARTRFTAEFTENVSVKKMLETYQQLMTA